MVRAEYMSGTGFKELHVSIVDIRSNDRAVAGASRLNERKRDNKN